MIIPNTNTQNLSGAKESSYEGNTARGLFTTNPSVEGPLAPL